MFSDHILGEEGQIAEVFQLNLKLPAIQSGGDNLFLFQQLPIERHMLIAVPEQAFQPGVLKFLNGFPVPFDLFDPPLIRKDFPPEYPQDSFCQYPSPTHKIHVPDPHAKACTRLTT
jgi:hypothetical protein